MSLFANALHRAGCGRRCVLYGPGDGYAGSDCVTHKPQDAEASRRCLAETRRFGNLNDAPNLSLEVSADRMRLNEQNLHGREVPVAGQNIHLGALGVDL